jgi:hypothetical protein
MDINEGKTGRATKILLFQATAKNIHSIFGHFLQILAQHASGIFLGSIEQAKWKENITFDCPFIELD